MDIPNASKYRKNNQNNPHIQQKNHSSPSPNPSSHQTPPSPAPTDQNTGSGLGWFWVIGAIVAFLFFKK